MTVTASTNAVHADLGIPTAAVPDEVIEKLKQTGVATVVQCLIRLGFHNQYLAGVQPRTKNRSFVGRAFTARTLPSREDVIKAQTNATNLHRRCFETIEPGQVLVIDARGNLTAGVLGDIYATRLVHRGGLGVVTDGCIRDLPAMDDVGVALYSRDVNARTFGEAHFVSDLNIPIQCANVLIAPGDLLVADGEGVVAIPQAVAAEVADAAVEQERLDGFVRAKVAAGALLAEAFPPNEQVRAEYEEWKKRRA